MGTQPGRVSPLKAPVPADLIRIHLAYHSWASERLIGACAELPLDELERDFHTADRSILGTLIHIYAADDTWLGRVQQRPREWKGKASIDLATLTREWGVVLADWIAWAAGLDDAAAAATIEFTDLRGKPWRSALGPIVLHVVNHGSHHRGQVAGFLRSLGHVPPVLDLGRYYRDLGIMSTEG